MADEPDDFADKSEDGSDPRKYHDRRRYAHPRSPGKKSEPGRKALQLCAQVHDVLLTLLASAGEAELQGLTVQSVLPAPNSGRLAILLKGDDPEAATAALQRAAGWLRAGVAASVNRKLVPELVFAVV